MNKPIHHVIFLACSKTLISFPHYKTSIAGLSFNVLIKIVIDDKCSIVDFKGDNENQKFWRKKSFFSLYTCCVLFRFDITSIQILKK